MMRTTAGRIQNTVLITTPEQEKALEIQEKKRQMKFAELFNERMKMEGPYCEFCGRSIAHQPTLNKKAYSLRRKYCSRACQSRSARRRANVRLNPDVSRTHFAKSLRFTDPLFFN
jgi:hypothetical protein